MKIKRKFRSGLSLGVSLAAIGASFVLAAPVAAQSETEGVASPVEGTGAGNSGNENEIVVTGSRIERAGFDLPTPTTVIGDTEIRQSARSNLQQVLNDLPQVRPSIIPTRTVGNNDAGTAPIDLRGLGTARTLTLINGRRFVGEGNLNFIPISLVQRLEVVTGGASAAWGSGAVAGVVNIILKNDLDGISLSAQTGISSRGDGARYQLDGSFGTRFADGNGHFMIGAEYVDDRGLPPSSRNDRPGFRSAGLIVTGVTNGVPQVLLADDVNISTRSESGLILNGIFAGQTFNADGTLRAYRGPDALGIGGEDASNLYDHLYLASPFKRLNTYARVSYDLGNATIWADVTYGQVKSNYDFLPDYIAPGDFGAGPITVQATNPFLSPAMRDQLASAGQASFAYSRAYTDILMIEFNSKRENIEGAVGIDGTFGNGWKYSAYFSHGEIDDRQEMQNSRVATNFTRAINAVMSGGQIVCAVNADTDPANDDPACRPLNIFGSGNASPEAIAYVTATQAARTVSKLDSAGVKLQGDLFSLWAGPVTVAVGAEARWEELTTSRPDSTVQGGFGLPIYTSDLSGGFNVKEGFGEIALPLLGTDAFKLDFNGAARYSDYNTSGSIWSWKVGGTARLFNDLLLRATRSRDIRSPSIIDLYSVRRLNIGPQVDQDTAGRNHPGYNPTPATVSTFSGGNPDLLPETSKTLTIGGSYSPSFLPGFSLSVDYYDIDIGDAISTLSASNMTLACANGNQAACARIERDPVTGTLVTVHSNAQNIAAFKTSGFDFEAAYATSMPPLTGDRPGVLRFRALATYIDRFIFDSGLVVSDTAGDVGDAVSGVPHWRGTLSGTYQDAVVGFDARLRYVGGGLFNHLLDGTNGQPNLVNNKIGSRIYLDIGAQFKIMDKFTFFGNVSNVFDRSAPITTGGQAHYDTIGRYFSVGAKVAF